MVETRGAVILSHGPWLDAKKQCQEPFTVDGVAFENLIALEDPQNKWVPVHRVPYEWDQEAWNDIITKIMRATPLGQSVLVTVIGLFETRTPLKGLVDMRLPFGRFEFGDQGLGPAQILLKKFKDAIVAHETVRVVK